MSYVAYHIVLLKCVHNRRLFLFSIKCKSESIAERLAADLQVQLGPRSKKIKKIKNLNSDDRALLGLAARKDAANAFSLCPPSDLALMVMN